MTFGGEPLGTAPLGSTVAVSSGGGDATASGVTLTATSDLIPGVATGNEAASITLTDIKQNSVFQRNGTSADVAVSGSLSGAADAIEARVVQHGTSIEVVTWTVLDAAPAAGLFAGTITVPQGGPYNVQVRFSNDVGVVSNGANPWNVGILALLVGQSQLVNWFDVGVHSAVAGAYRQSGSVFGGSSGSWAAMPTTGNGANEFAAQLIAQYGCPVGMLGYASGGTLISQWDQSTDTLPRHAIKAVQDCGGAVEYILWSQGEANGSAGTAQATYEAGLTSVIANFRAQITNRSTKPNLPIVLSLLGRGSSIGTDDQASAIRAAQFAIAGSVADVYIGAETLDIPLADPAHYTAAGYVTHGKRMAQTVKYLLGDATYHRGPYITSATRVDSTHTEVTIAHRGGTDFTPTTGIIGFEIDDGGSIVVPSAADRQSATVVLLTHAALSSGSPTVRYGYGADGGATFALTISNVLTDNTAMALPLEQSSGWVIGIHSTAPGATLTATAELTPGQATGSGSATAPGATLTATSELTPGGATGQQNATGPGATLTATSDLAPGTATGGSAGDATAPGATLTATSDLAQGTATGEQNPSLVDVYHLVASDVRLTSIMHEVKPGVRGYLPGEVAVLNMRAAGLDGVAADPGALVLKIRPPVGAVVSYAYGTAAEVVRDAAGRYHADLMLSAAGQWAYRWELSAPNAGAAEGVITVLKSRVI